MAMQARRQTGIQLGAKKIASRAAAFPGQALQHPQILGIDMLLGIVLDDPDRTPGRSVLHERGEQDFECRLVQIVDVRGEPSSIDHQHRFVAINHRVDLQLPSVRYHT